MTEERMSMLAKLFELAEKLTSEEWTVLTAYADGVDGWVAFGSGVLRAGPEAYRFSITRLCTARPK